jgi:hypothetical protein
MKKLNNFYINILYMNNYNPIGKIIINSTHYDANSNTYKYKFPFDTKFESSKHMISCTNYSVFNSFYNISSERNNNTYSINWLGTTYNYTIRDGFYSIADINNVISSAMVSDNLYTLSSSASTSTTVYIYISADMLRLSLFPIFLLRQIFRRLLLLTREIGFHRILYNPLL